MERKIFIGPLLVFLSSLVYSMETTKTMQPRVVNYNSGDQIEEMDSAIIFGMTPRFSSMQEFATLVARDAEELSSTKKKGMRADLKKISPDKLRLIYQKFKNVDMHTKYDDTHMKCFFECGYNTKLVDQNLGKYLKAAQGVPADVPIVHILLPSYFEDLDDKMDTLCKQESLKFFLPQSAQYLCDLYSKASVNRQVYIIIPLLEEFTKPINDARKSIADILHKVVLPRVSNATIVNQSKEQIYALLDALGEVGYSPKKLRGIYVPIHVGSGLQVTKTFFPRTIPPKKVPASTLSCVVSQRLVDVYDTSMPKDNDDE